MRHMPPPYLIAGRKRPHLKSGGERGGKGEDLGGCITSSLVPESREFLVYGGHNWSRGLGFQEIEFRRGRGFESRQNMSTNSTMGDMSRVGLGYGIAIAVGILVLLSTVMLASYVCVRVHGRSQLAGGVVQREAVHRETGAAAATGVDQATLDSYPLVTFSEKRSHGEEVSCSICLSEYKESEVLRMLPECLHLFHVHCIDAWLRLHASCPMCRTSPLPTPIATPLSEFIPLARHPRISSA